MVKGDLLLGGVVPAVAAKLERVWPRGHLSRRGLDIGIGIVDGKWDVMRLVSRGLS